MKNIAIQVNATSFPSQLVTDSEKHPKNLDYKWVRASNMSGSKKTEVLVDIIDNGDIFV
jgi:hypothetical protein